MNMFYHGGYHHSHSMSDSSARIDANAARRESAQTKTEMHYLEDEIDRLSLVCESLWTLLKDKIGVTDDELTSIMVDLDMKDGKLDGKRDKSGPRRCPACDRPNNKRHLRCMYCGALFKTTPFE